MRPKEPANIGSAARAMKNFGLSDLWLVAPQRAVSAKAYALASHAGEILDNASYCDTVQEAIGGCKVVLGTTARPRATASFPVYMPRQAARALPAEGVAIMFGPEDFGLSNEDLNVCQGYIQIPTADYASLNLAQAVQLIAYEWFVSGFASEPQTKPNDLSERATLELLNGMYDQLIEVLHLIGYTDAQREASASRLFRSIFDRAELSEREVTALRGLWSQVSWAARQAPDALPQSKNPQETTCQDS